MDFEIACTLSASELSERRRTVLAGLRRAATAVARSETGWIFDFPDQPEILADIQRVIELERQCCRFLIFTTSQNGDRIRLEISAPPQAQDIIADFFGDFAT